MENNQNKRVVDIKPLGKWKRILVFLGDFFMCFILGFILFNVAVFPITKAAIGGVEKNERMNQLVNESNDMLVEAGLMYYPREEDNIEKTYENSADYTFKVFISYYLYEEETPLINNPQLGHKLENEVIRKYYIEYRNDLGRYLEVFNEVNKEFNYFDIGQTADSIALKEQYMSTFRLLFEESSEEGYPEQITNLKESVFDRLFTEFAHADIVKNDFIFNGKSYNDLLFEADKINDTLNWATVAACGITLLISVPVIYLVYPMFQGEHRTPTMSIMKVDRLNFKNMNYIKRSNVLLHLPFEFIFALGGCLFFPAILFGLEYCFNLPLLFVFFLVSMVLMLASLILILANEFNRSGSDILSFMVLVPTDELDKIYVVDGVKNE